MKYDICVIGGAGHVGLPLSICFAREGRRVVIHDIDAEALETINQGRMPFMETGAEPLLREVIGGRLTTTLDPEVISESRVVIIIIGTPVDEHLNPRFHEFRRFLENLRPHFRDGQIVVLRSTVYPGTTERTRELLQRDHPNLEVCFCPERIAEGKAIEELYSLPQIVSGFDARAVEEVADLFRLFTPDILMTEPAEAELAKLFSNAWRYIQFSIANQFYMVAEEYGLDFHRIHAAMTHNYPRLSSFPKPGFAAGPCLFKDTMQLSAFSNNRFFLGHSAMLINEGLPNFVVDRLKREHDLSRMTVGILGMAFKAESDDKRESLSYKLHKVLTVEAREVLCSDPYIDDPAFVDEQELLRRSDAVFIGAPHARYAGLDFSGKLLIDVWNVAGQCGSLNPS